MLATKAVGLLEVMRAFLTEAHYGDTRLASRFWFFVRREKPSVYRLLEDGWVPESIWTWCRRHQFHLAANRTWWYITHFVDEVIPSHPYAVNENRVELLLLFCPISWLHVSVNLVGRR